MTPLSSRFGPGHCSLLQHHLHVSGLDTAACSTHVLGHLSLLQHHLHVSGLDSVPCSSTIFTSQDWTLPLLQHHLHVSGLDTAPFSNTTFTSQDWTLHPAPAPSSRPKTGNCSTTIFTSQDTAPTPSLCLRTLLQHHLHILGHFSNTIFIS